MSAINDPLALAWLKKFDELDKSYKDELREAKAEIARLTTERNAHDRLIADTVEALMDDLRGTTGFPMAIKNIKRERDAAKAEIARLRVALKTFDDGSALAKELHRILKPDTGE